MGRSEIDLYLQRFNNFEYERIGLTENFGLGFIHKEQKVPRLSMHPDVFSKTAQRIILKFCRGDAGEVVSRNISVKRACSALTSGLSVWPEFGGDGAPIQLTPRSGNLPHSRPT